MEDKLLYFSRLKLKSGIQKLHTTKYTAAIQYQKRDVCSGTHYSRCFAVEISTWWYLVSPVIIFNVACTDCTESCSKFSKRDWLYGPRVPQSSAYADTGNRREVRVCDLYNVVKGEDLITYVSAGVSARITRSAWSVRQPGAAASSSRSSASAAPRARTDRPRITRSAPRTMPGTCQPTLILDLATQFQVIMVCNHGRAFSGRTLLIGIVA